MTGTTRLAGIAAKGKHQWHALEFHILEAVAPFFHLLVEGGLLVRRNELPEFFTAGPKPGPAFCQPWFKFRRPTFRLMGQGKFLFAGPG